MWDSLQKIMHFLFSHMMDVDHFCTYLTSTKSCLRQTTIDNAMAGSFLYFHEMTTMPTKNTFPMMDGRLFASPAQSAL